MTGVYEFGEFRLNTVERSIESAGRPVSLSPKALHVLIVLVENRGRIVEKDDLMRRVWPGTFVEDNSLAFNVSVLRKMFGEGGRSPRYIETIPKRGYRFIAEVRGPAEEKINPLPDTDQLAETRPLDSRLRPSWRLALFVLVGVSALLTAWRMWRVLDASPGSLAVLPFSSLDAPSADEGLEIGLTDALTARLSRSLSIPVRPVAAVLRYRNQWENPLAAGRALRVDAILEGTFQKHDGKIRISFRLLRSRDGKVLYSGVFDKKTTELFLLEDEISTELAGSLILKLASRNIAPRKPPGPVPYAAYLKGRYFWNRRTRSSIHQAIDYFKEAIAADPEYALAYAGLADAYLLLPTYERIPNTVMMPMARAAAERAIQIDGDMAEPHASLGLLAVNYDYDWATGEREFLTALRLNPSYPSGRHWYAEYIGTMGRVRESEAEFERARSLDPLSAAIPADEAKIFWFNRQYGKTAALARQSLTLDPTFTLAHLMLGASLVDLGNCSGAVAEVGPGIVDDSDTTLAIRIFVNWRCGFHAEAMSTLARLVGEGRAEGTPFMVAAGYAVVGDSDRAQQWLERTVTERGFGLFTLRSNPAFDGIRSGARFRQLLASLRLN